MSLFFVLSRISLWQYRQKNVAKGGGVGVGGSEKRKKGRGQGLAV